MTSERTGHSIKMRRSLVRFSGSDLSIHTRSSAGFITIMSGFRFSVRTGQTAAMMALVARPVTPCLSKSRALSRGAAKSKKARSDGSYFGWLLS